MIDEKVHGSPSVLFGVSKPPEMQDEKKEAAATPFADRFVELYVMKEPELRARNVRRQLEMFHQKLAQPQTAFLDDTRYWRAYCMLVYENHAGDRETVTFDGRRVVYTMGNHVDSQMVDDIDLKDEFPAKLGRNLRRTGHRRFRKLHTTKSLENTAKTLITMMRLGWAVPAMRDTWYPPDPPPAVAKEAGAAAL
jgi:hypothetical protein